jgi:hypothetical protein
MWNLDDQSLYLKVLDLWLPWATTYANTSPGKKDVDKREKIREQAAPHMSKIPDGVDQWAFRISVSRSRQGPFDIENVPKPIVDAFCAKQIKADGSRYTALGLYPDDTLDYVVVLEVAGIRGVLGSKATTHVEIFAVQKKGSGNEHG